MKLGQRVELELTQEERKALAKELRALVLEHIKKIVLNQALERHQDRINYWSGLLVSELHDTIAQQYPLPQEKE